MYSDLKSRGSKRKFSSEEDEDSIGDHNLNSKVQRHQHQRDTNKNVTTNSSTNNNNNSNNKVSQLLKNAILSTEKNLVSRYNNSLNGRNQCYIRQRHQIFNISMCKLNRFRQTPDPSLHRSVLICNTLRTLERELEREGIKINFGPNGVSFIPPIVNTQNMTLDPPPSVALSSSSSSSQSTPAPTSSTSSTPPPQSLATLNQNENVNETQNYIQQLNSSICEPESNSSTNSLNSDTDYDRYLLDLDSSCGRVTPFLKQSTSSSSSSSNSSSSSSSSSGSSNSSSSSYERNISSSEFTSQSSAFWNSEDNSDRLTNLNWSSVLNFNSSTNSSSSNNSVKNSNGLACGESDPVSDSELITTTDGPNNNDNSITSFTTLMSPSVSSSSTISLNQNSLVSQSVINNSQTNHMTSLQNGTILSSYTNSIINSEEIFGDIDLSLYDFDLLSPLSPPNVKMAPVTAEELIKTITPTDSNSNMSSMSISSSSSLSSSQSSLTSTSFSSSSSSPSSPSSSLSSPPPLSCSSASSSSTWATSTSSEYHNHYFKSSEKLFVEEKVMS